MPLRLSQTAEEDYQTLCFFLRDAFDLKDGSPMLDEAMMRWKFWQPRPDWEGSRSYQLCQENNLIAHAGILPAVLHDGSAAVRALHFIDWASSPRSVSGGVQLLRRLTALTDVLCAVGGSDATRKILPAFGFKPHGTVLKMVRPLRPWLQLRTHQRRNWKLPLRFARSTIWNLTSSLKAPAPWTFVAANPNDVPSELWTTPGPQATLERQRSPSVTDYFLTCPDVRFRFYCGCERDIPQGCFLISHLPGQARIADVWVREPTPERYKAMYRLACIACCQDPQIAEIVAYSSIESRTCALQQCGFRAQVTAPLMVFGGSAHLLAEIDCQMIDSDAAFLREPGFNYCT